MANLFSDFLKPFASGIAKPAVTTQGSPFSFSLNPGAAAATPVAQNVAPTEAPPVGTQPVTLPNGANVYMNKQGGVASAPSSFVIDTSKPVTSDIMGANVTNTDVQNLYAQYAKQLADAYKPSQDYLNALAAVQDINARNAQLDANLITGNNLPGDTMDYAEGRTAKAKGLNAIEGLRANQALQVQELIRTGNIEASKALVEAYQKTPYSATASPFGGYLVFDARTGNYEVVGADAITNAGGGAGGGAGTPSIPSFLQPAIGEIGGLRFIDTGKINPNQLPYAQQVSASTGIPLLTETDANKLKEAQAAFGGASSLVDAIADNGLKLIYAETPAQALVQRAQLEAQAALPVSTEAKYFKDTVGAFISLITRAAGERGVLTDQDVERIRNALPNFGDTRPIAEQKAKQLQSVLNSTLQGALSAYLPPVQPSGGGSSSVDISVYAW